MAQSRSRSRLGGGGGSGSGWSALRGGLGSRYFLRYFVKSQGEIEAAVCDGISRFQQEFLGRGPSDIHAHLIGSLLVVRLQGALTPAERQLIAPRHFHGYCRRGPGVFSRRTAHLSTQIKGLARFHEHHRSWQSGLGQEHRHPGACGRLPAFLRGSWRTHRGSGRPLQTGIPRHDGAAC